MDRPSKGGQRKIKERHWGKGILPRGDMVVKKKEAPIMGGGQNSGSGGIIHEGMVVGSLRGGVDKYERKKKENMFD